MKVLGPACSSIPLTDRLMPVIIDAMAMTTMTPIATPRMVRAARALLTRIDSNAIPTPSRIRAGSSRLIRASRRVGAGTGRQGAPNVASLIRT